MSEDVSQESVLSIAEDIGRLLRRLELERSGALARLADAEAALEAALAEVAAAKAGSAKADKRFAKASAAFADDDDDDDDDDAAPAEVVVVVEARPVAAAAAPTPKAAVKASPSKANGAAGSSRVSAKRERSTLTVPERVAAVMGDGVWDAGALEQVLANAGEDFKSKSANLRTYISSILSGTRIHVRGPDGKDLTKEDGAFVEVRMFTSVERGKYRVATEDEIQREARKVLGSDEFILSQTQRTPADDMFAEQGIDILPAIAATQ